jgi:hypothetical protein
MKITLEGPPMRGLCSGCRVDLDRMARDGFAGHVCDVTLMSVDERIVTGALPMILMGADWRRYAGREPATRDYDGFCRMWRDVAWVRRQAFEREAEAEWEAGYYQ